tara:strand:+ start:209 stop:874 length:666 start_codon:yes stop_codon:yes gene_type:complete
MTNEKIILKIQEIKAHVEMLSRKIDEHRPQEAKKVVVDVDAIVEQSVVECKKLIGPLEAQNNKLKNDNAITVDGLTKKIDTLTKDNKQIKKSLEDLRQSMEKEILKTTKNINTVNSNLNDCIDFLSESLKSNIKINDKKQRAKLVDLQLTIDSNTSLLDKKISVANNEIKKSFNDVVTIGLLDKKISVANNEAAKQFRENIEQAISKKVNINFVNNLYRTK